MGSRYYLLLVLLCSFKLCAQNSRFKVAGTVDTKYNDSLVTLFTFTGDIVRTVDSTYVKNGRFSFEGLEYLYEKSLISLGNYPDTVLFAEVILEKGNIFVELKKKSSVHSPLMDDYEIFQDSCRVLWKRFSLEKDLVLKKKLYDQFFSYRYTFKKKHIYNALGRSVFLDDISYSDDPYFIQLYEMLSDRDRSRGDVKAQYDYWEKRNKRLQLKGKQYMDFVLVDSLGDEKKISDYIGKYDFLFIDFWASWCGPCRAQEPHLVRLYREYEDKGLGILRISLDTDRTKWLSMLKNTHGLWAELCVANGEDEKRLRKLYNIAGIPFGVIVDKSGRITSVVTAGWQYLEMLLKAYYKDDIVKMKT